MNRINKNQSTESLESRISRITLDFYRILHRSLLYSNLVTAEPLWIFCPQHRDIKELSCHLPSPWSRTKTLTHHKECSHRLLSCMYVLSWTVISLTHGLRHRFNMLSRPKSWWQGPTSVNGVGHSPKTRPQTLTDGPDIGHNRQLARCVRALHFRHSLSSVAKALCQ